MRLKTKWQRVNDDVEYTEGPFASIATVETVRHFQKLQYMVSVNNRYITTENSPELAKMDAEKAIINEIKNYVYE